MPLETMYIWFQYIGTKVGAILLQQSLWTDLERQFCHDSDGRKESDANASNISASDNVQVGLPGRMGNFSVKQEMGSWNPIICFTAIKGGTTCTLPSLCAFDVA